MLELSGLLAVLSKLVLGHPLLLILQVLGIHPDPLSVHLVYLQVEARDFVDFYPAWAVMSSIYLAFVSLKKIKSQRQAA